MPAVNPVWVGSRKRVFMFHSSKAVSSVMQRFLAPGAFSYLRSNGAHHWWREAAQDEVH